MASAELVGPALDVTSVLLDVGVPSELEAGVLPSLEEDTTELLLVTAASESPSPCSSSLEEDLAELLLDLALLLNSLVSPSFDIGVSLEEDKEEFSLCEFPAETEDELSPQAIKKIAKERTAGNFSCFFFDCIKGGGAVRSAQIAKNSLLPYEFHASPNSESAFVFGVAIKVTRGNNVCPCGKTKIKPF